MTAGTAILVGAGHGLSAALARKLAARSYDLVLAARDTGKISDLALETGARTVQMDGSDPKAMADLFAGVADPIRVAIYHPSARQRGPVAELDPEEVRRAIEITAFGAFLLGREAARRMIGNDTADGRKGTILFTGASAGVKGFPNSAPFAMGKFAQRGLAQSMARELHPKGIHVAWINIDGQIANDDRPGYADDGTDSKLNPDAIADAYMMLLDQHRSTWTNELDLRPWVEKF